MFVFANQKGKVKLFLLANEMILYTKNPKNSTKKMSQLLNKFIKVARYKLKIQKLVVLPYTNNKTRGKNILFTIA